MVQMEEVAKKIEERRNLLYSMAHIHAFTSEEMLTVSRELDELLNLYEKLRCAAV